MTADSLVLGQEAGGGGNQLQTLKTAINAVLGVMFLISFPWAVVTIWQGAQMKKRGEPEAYNSIIAGLWIAGAAVIIGVIFAAFNLNGAVGTPTF
jgi:hypothetical protein